MAIHQEREDGKTLCGRAMPEDMYGSDCRTCANIQARVLAERAALDEVIKELRDTGFDLGWADPEDIYPKGGIRGHIGSTYITWESGPMAYWRGTVTAEPYEFRVPYVSFGDVAAGEDRFNQTSTVDRSNYRSLKRDFPQVPWVDVSYTNRDDLGIFVSSLLNPEWGREVIDILCGLKDQYPVYDEDDLSLLEYDEIDESWGQFMAWDLKRELEDTPAWDVWEYIGDDEVYDLFWGAVGGDVFGNYPEHNGIEVVWGSIEDRAREFAPILIDHGATLGGHPIPGQMMINESEGN